MVLHNSVGGTSRSSAGLSESLDAKGERGFLIYTWELSTPHFMSGVKPLLGTPVDGKEESNTEGETKEAVASTQSVVY